MQDLRQAIANEPKPVPEPKPERQVIPGPEQQAVRPETSDSSKDL